MQLKQQNKEASKHLNFLNISQSGATTHDTKRLLGSQRGSQAKNRVINHQNTKSNVSQISKNADSNNNYYRLSYQNQQQSSLLGGLQSNLDLYNQQDFKKVISMIIEDDKMNKSNKIIRPKSCIKSRESMVSTQDSNNLKKYKSSRHQRVAQFKHQQHLVEQQYLSQEYNNQLNKIMNDNVYGVYDYQPQYQILQTNQNLTQDSKTQDQSKMNTNQNLSPSQSLHNLTLENNLNNQGERNNKQHMNSKFSFNNNADQLSHTILHDNYTNSKNTILNNSGKLYKNDLRIKDRLYNQRLLSEQDLPHKNKSPTLKARRILSQSIERNKKDFRNNVSGLSSGGRQSLQSESISRGYDHDRYYSDPEHSHFNSQELNKTLMKNTRKDHLFVVLWKLHKIAQTEINPGQTTAYKHFNNASEAKRFKKSLHQLTQLQRSMLYSSDEQEAIEKLKRFVILALNHSLPKYQVYLSDENLKEVGQRLMCLELQKLDPKYSLSQMVKKLLKNEDIFQDPEAAFREFQAHILKVQAKRQQMDEIEKHSIPQKNEQRIQQICKDQKFYDVSDVFWNGCNKQDKKRNPAKVVQKYLHLQEKQEEQCSTSNRLAQYIKSNKLITQPEVPQPHIVRQFPFASKVGQNINNKKHHPKMKQRLFGSMVSTLRNKVDQPNNGAYSSMGESANTTQQKLDPKVLIKTTQVTSEKNKINKKLNNLSVANIEQSSIIQRNKLFLEHVICNRKKDIEHSMRQKKLSEHQYKVSMLNQRRPPSSIYKLSPSKNIGKSFPEENNHMIFLKNERMIYF
ncbi:UNKNOWN [Stylonychia lemnae]|uniref:Uncharacterized protein n=1 Tax=Stylonychia lemnae TaxID=5949 RepID=A0A078ACE5_STYLE|nr:UNKNOWN [Stylonychia lemnae]|eukprot:CDW79267.1 UNKNOWN [Stylonychia lemnae]